MVCDINSVVIPGDVVLNIGDDNKNKIVIGPGLRVSGNRIIATKPGRFRKKKPNTYWVDFLQKRYVASRGETLVGVVNRSAGEVYRVEIGAADMAQLPILAFEGASKKNRPNIAPGDLVCGRLSVAGRDFEPELVCFDSSGQKSRLGVLPAGGLLFTCSLNLVRKLLHPKCPLLTALQKRLNVPFEIAVGMNGFIWIRTKNIDDTIAIGNAIIAAEFKSQQEIHSLCEHIATILAGPT